MPSRPVIKCSDSSSVKHQLKRRESLIHYKAWLEMNHLIAAVENLLYTECHQQWCSGMLRMPLYEVILLISPAVLHIPAR